MVLALQPRPPPSITRRLSRRSHHRTAAERDRRDADGGRAPPWVFAARSVARLSPSGTFRRRHRAVRCACASASSIWRAWSKELQIGDPVRPAEAPCDRSLGLEIEWNGRSRTSTPQVERDGVYLRHTVARYLFGPLPRLATGVYLPHPWEAFHEIRRSPSRRLRTLGCAPIG
jgi:hypothetical protein